MARLNRIVDRITRALKRAPRRIVRGVVAVARVVPGRSIGAVEGISEPLQGWVTVRGWAFRRRDPVVAVVVTVNDEAAAMATYGMTRRDVAQRRRGGENSGWTARINVSAASTDLIAIGALVLTRAGLVEALDPKFIELVHTSEVGGVTRPQVDATVAPGAVVVEGWLLTPSMPTRIEISIDGAPVGRARLFAASQPELANASSLPWAPLAGFAYVADLSGAPAGQSHQLRIDATAVDGTRTTLGPREIRIAAPPAASDVPPEVQRLAEQVRACHEPAGEEPPEPLRLLVVTHQLDLGGGQLYMYELLRHLLSDLDMTCLIVSSTDGVLRSKLEELGAEVFVCGRPSVTSPLEYEHLQVELATLVRSHRCNAAFVNTMSCAFGADLAERLDLPVVWAIHESYPLAEFIFAAYGENVLHPYIEGRMKAALASADAVVFEADATRMLYEPHGDPQRFITVPYGVPLADIDEHRRRANRHAFRHSQGFADRETVILSVGTFEPRKGQGLLALAFAEVADEFPDSVLVMVGDTGIPYAQGVRQLVERLKLDHRIRLLPVVENAYAWYQMADALITVSDVESMPRSVLEAMALGVPIVAADVFGLGELLHDGVTGLLCEARDTGAVVNALRRLLSMSAKERAALGARGAELVQTHYDSSGYATAYRRLLRGLVAKPGSLPRELLS